MSSGAFSYYVRNSPKSFFIFMSAIGLFFSLWGGWELYARINNQSWYVSAQDAGVVLGESGRGIMENVYVSFRTASDQRVVGVSSLLLGQAFTKDQQVDVLYNPMNNAEIQIVDWRTWFDPIISFLLGVLFLFFAYQHGLRRWNRAYEAYGPFK